MQLQINGKPRLVSLGPGGSLQSLLDELGVHPSVVVELNGKIVPRDRFGAQVLQDGDSLEIVHIVGGG